MMERIDEPTDFTEWIKDKSDDKNKLWQEFTSLVVHHGKCDCCYERCKFVIHIHPSDDVYHLKRGDYRICLDCIKLLFDEYKKIKGDE